MVNTITGRAKHLLRATLIMGAALLPLTSCAPTFSSHGYAPDEATLESLLIGVDTRETIGLAVGTPQFAGMEKDRVWYFSAIKTRNYLFYAPEITERRVIAISFAEDGTLMNVEEFGLEDGKVVALARRTTRTAVKSPGFIAQMLGNIGQIDLGRALGN